MLSPESLYKHHLGSSCWEFKKNVTYWAGVHFERNVKAIKTKWNISVLVTGLFCLEVVLVVFWILFQVPSP